MTVFAGTIQCYANIIAIPLFNARYQGDQMSL
jgi:hypothetical protein